MSTAKELYKAGESLNEAGKLDEAAAQYQAALAVDPTHVLSHMALSIVYQKLDKHAAAVEHAEKVCELEPTDPFNFTALSVTYQRAFEGTRDPMFIQKAEEAKYRADMARG
ncbi:tetratricopeptide repeat protein [Blastopirellula marina]|uniref:Nuclear scaffold-like protein p76-like n=1 Tax=Blastopirellula marina DSM 3645 TaxID=314230 RepID=A3ZYF1_9BACT|nr:tetratricopeptide repeat protein [Blastopirellula marina]EAQ78399.1 nuclear scaffold-like protein p76-like [Blastopirellula marina DSM 3645]